jgi:hypothetical protein
MANDYIPQTEAEAIKLGYKKTTKPIDAIRKHVDRLMMNNVEGAIREECTGGNDRQICLQTDCGSDGTRTVCYCQGISCGTNDHCYEVPC